MEKYILKILKSDAEDYEKVYLIETKYSDICSNFVKYLFENNYQIFDELYVVSNLTGTCSETSEMFRKFIENYLKHKNN